MDKKIMLVSVIGFIAIITMIVISSTNGVNMENSEQGINLAGQAIKGLEVPNPPNVNAHSCNADNTCETENLLVEQYIINSNGTLMTGELHSYGDLTVQGDTYLDKSLYVDGDGMISIQEGLLAADTIIANTIQVDFPGGLGQLPVSYACFDPWGVLYASQEPCVD